MNRCVFKTKPYGGNETKTMCRLLFFSFCLLLFYSVLVQSSYAHKVNIFAYAENGRIHAEGYFVDGSKCKNAQVDVIDKKTGEKLFEGKTDNNGQFLFDIPRVTTLQLILHAGTGHQNEYILYEEELREAISETAENKKKEQKVKQTKERGYEVSETVPESKPKQREKPVSVQHGMNTMSHDMEESIEKIVDRKLKPVMKVLMTLQEKSEKPGITEILGGIGYIIGILGVIAYFKGRSKKP